MTSVVNLPAAGRAPGPGQTVNAAACQARAPLDMSLAIPITCNVTLILAAFAQLALTEGDPERVSGDQWHRVRC